MSNDVNYSFAAALQCREICFEFKKPKMSRCRPLYYPNSTASRQILLQGGDISLNPGPRQLKTQCEECEKTIRKNQSSVSCSECMGLRHVKCTNLTSVSLVFTCNRCLISVLPFHNCPDLNMLDTQTITNSALSEDLTINTHLEALNARYNQLKLVHLNTQSMLSGFDELLVTMQEYPFDIVALSETW